MDIMVAKGFRYKSHMAHKGGIIRKKIQCEICGEKNKMIVMHHEDYNNYLDILWLCKACHAIYHGIKRRCEYADCKISFEIAKKYVRKIKEDSKKRYEVYQSIDKRGNRPVYKTVTGDLFTDFKARCVELNIKIYDAQTEMIEWFLNKHKEK